VVESLVPLIEFAKEVLAGKEHQFSNFPIFLKATGEERQNKKEVGRGSTGWWSVMSVPLTNSCVCD